MQASSLTKNDKNGRTICTAIGALSWLSREKSYCLRFAKERRKDRILSDG